MSLRICILSLLVAVCLGASRSSESSVNSPNQLTVSLLGVRNLRQVAEGKKMNPFVELVLKRRGSSSDGPDQMWRSYVVKEGGQTVNPWPGQQRWSVMYSGEQKLEIDVLHYDPDASDPRKLVGLVPVDLRTFVAEADGSKHFSGPLQLKRNGLGGQAGFIDVKIDIVYSPDVFFVQDSAAGGAADASGAAGSGEAQAQDREQRPRGEAAEEPERRERRGGQ